MIRRVSLPWPANAARDHPETVRLLAVSDEPERSLSFERNRDQIGRVDAVLGCGDLEPHYLAFLADAFNAPLLYIRGNHDRGPNWTETHDVLPGSIKAETILGVSIVGLSWPGNEREPHAIHDDSAAWRQAMSIGLRLPRPQPLIVMSHVPPRGLGDVPEDHYHRGFAAYHWLCRRLRPQLWLHGHTSMAAAADWRVQWGGTTLVNVTGAVVVEVAEPARLESRAAATRDDKATIAVSSGGRS
jgi:uncharacterized protein